MVPETSSTLIRAIAADNQSVRWNEFVARYRPMMMGYLKSKFSNIMALKMMLMQVLGIDKFPCYLMIEEKNLRKWLLILVRLY